MKNINASFAHYDNSQWDRDIDSFERYRKMLETMKHADTRAYMIREMHRIKDKYPALKNEIVPKE